MTWFWAVCFTILAITTLVALVARYGSGALSAFTDLWDAYLWQEVGDATDSDE